MKKWNSASQDDVWQTWSMSAVALDLQRTTEPLLYSKQNQREKSAMRLTDFQTSRSGTAAEPKSPAELDRDDPMTSNTIGNRDIPTSIPWRLSSHNAIPSPEAPNYPLSYPATEISPLLPRRLNGVTVYHNPKHVQRQWPFEPSPPDCRTARVATRDQGCYSMSGTLPGTLPTDSKKPRVDEPGVVADEEAGRQEKEAIGGVEGTGMVLEDDAWQGKDDEYRGRGPAGRFLAREHLSELLRSDRMDMEAQFSVDDEIDFSDEEDDGRRRGHGDSCCCCCCGCFHWGRSVWKCCRWHSRSGRRQRELWGRVCRLLSWWSRLEAWDLAMVLSTLIAWTVFVVLVMQAVTTRDEYYDGI